MHILQEQQKLVAALTGLTLAELNGFSLSGHNNSMSDAGRPTGCGVQNSINRFIISLTVCGCLCAVCACVGRLVLAPIRIRTRILRRLAVSCTTARSCIAVTFHRACMPAAATMDSARGSSSFSRGMRCMEHNPMESAAATTALTCRSNRPYRSMTLDRVWAVLTAVHSSNNILSPLICKHLAVPLHRPLWHWLS